MTFFSKLVFGTHNLTYRYSNSLEYIKNLPKKCGDVYKI